jgi:SAM-dependent methyltransferase
MSAKAHWEKVYAAKSVNEVSWYQERLKTSLKLIQRADLASDAEIIDIGGGASTLVDDLVRIDFQNVSVLDLSASALEQAKARLGNLGERVHWIEGDITHASLAANHYDLWHDRAVFHFLTEADKRMAYVAAATQALKSGGFLIMATFALDGPTKCSGLPVERYGPQELARQFPAFTLLDDRREQHQTPFGTIQNFTYVLMQKRDEQ